jgi:hypothetical protein
MSTAKKGISSELIAQDYFNRDPNNLVFVPLLGIGMIDIVVLNKKTKKIFLYDVKTVSRRTKPYKRSKLGSIIYRPLKAVQKKLGVRIVLVDETTGQVIIPEKKENVEQKKADRR